MKIKNDYSYITTSNRELIDRGYGVITAYSIHFDRYYSEQEKQHNSDLCASMTREEWGKHCDEVAESFAAPMLEILGKFAEKYDIHQVSSETSTMEHFRSNWDLYFNPHTIRGYDNKSRFDSFTLTFNDRRVPTYNNELLEEILRLIETLEYKNIACRVQYSAFLYNGKIEEAAAKAFETISQTFVNYLGRSGKIRIVGEFNGQKKYGFFEKYAKKVYAPMPAADVLALTFK